MIRIILCISLFLSGCSQSCKSDLDFIKLYTDALKSIKNHYEKDDNSKSLYEADKAILFVSRVSGYPSHKEGTNFGYEYVYFSLYHTDMRLWEEWLEDNKCGFTMENADSIFFNLNHTLGNTSNNWKEYLLSSNN